MLNIQEVYEQYFTVVYRYLLSLSHNTHIAEELTQETFFKALKKVDDFRGDCDLRVWLCQISKNTYYDYLKKNKKYVPESQEETEDIFTSDLLQNFSDKETAFQVHQVLHRLSEPYKEVFFPSCVWRTVIWYNFLAVWQKRKLGKSYLSQSM